MWNGEHDDETQSPFTVEKLKNIDKKLVKLNSKLLEKQYLSLMDQLKSESADI